MEYHDTEYHDCVIVYKNGKGIALRSTRFTVENDDKLIIVYNCDDIMAIIPLDQIKTLVFADCGDPEDISKLIEAISANIHSA